MTKAGCRYVALTVLFALAGIALPAQAQKMYRCGNVYQDRPCAGAQQGRVIGSTGAGQSSAAHATDGYCAKRGERAQKIMWAKEVGRTEDMQLSAAASEEDRKLIGDVYRKRGSSVEVRAAIEADCAAERKRAEQAAALVEAAARLQGQGQPGPAVANPSAATVDANGDAAARQKQEMAREAASRKAQCDSIAARLESIQNSQRAGGSVATMDGLHRQQQAVERERSQAGC